MPPASARRRAVLAGRRHLADEDGFTLSEMLTVLAILGIIVAGLSQLFVSASNSQVDQTNRVGAQQDARLGLDKLRREIHCASGLSSFSANSITATLPGYCIKTTLSGSLTLPSTTINVAGTANFPSGSNTIAFASSTTATTVTCSGKTSTSFTGCSGGTAGTYPAGATVTSTVASSGTWCTKASGAAYSLQRFDGSACSGSGTTWADSLVSGSIFTQNVVSAPAFDPPATGRLGAGTYTYEVTAVTASGEIPGTLAVTTVSGTSKAVTIKWSAYTGATSYNVYGRDNVNGVRLLAAVPTGSTSFLDQGPTTLKNTGGVLTLPNATIGVLATDGFNSGANTITFGASENVTCTGTTTTSFTGCSGGAAGQYPDNTVVTSASSRRPPPLALGVLLVVDKTPGDSKQRFTVNDDIELRNSRPF